MLFAAYFYGSCNTIPFVYLTLQLQPLEEFDLRPQSTAHVHKVPTFLKTRVLLSFVKEYKLLA